MAQSLLPPNATPLEKAYAETVAALLDLPVVIDDLWSPDRCPAKFLHILAWGLGVPVWNVAWNEETKRNVCRTAIEQHRRRGTVGAVKAAIGAVGGQAQLIEWFNDTPVAAPATFRVRVTFSKFSIAGAPLLSSSKMREIGAMVDSSKNLRSHYTIQIGTGLSAAAAFVLVGRIQHRKKIEGTLQ